jgi:hypothetical protein
MKRFLILSLFVFACACGIQAQVVDTNVCDVLKNPKSFDGKIVRIKGTVVAGFDQFMVKDSSTCGFAINSIWLSYPQGTKGKAGPIALLEIQPAHNFSATFTPEARTPVTLDKSKDFKQFDSLLAQAHNKGAGMCLGCARYEVSATLVGRLDGVADATLERNKAGKIVGFGGFGNMNAYPARLVLQSVSDVSPKEVDFSKSDEVTKGQTQTFAGNADLYDPLVAARKSAAALASSPAGAQAAKDIDAYGKPNEHNGVIIGYGTMNEVPAKGDTLGAKDSPDGILYICTFNQGRLEGDAELRALMHMGQHVSDMRNPTPGNEDAPLFIMEYNAWTMTAAASVASGQKFLTMPGGYILWNSSWPGADRISNMDTALKSFLANEALLTR